MGKFVLVLVVAFLLFIAMKKLVKWLWFKLFGQGWVRVEKDFRYWRTSKNHKTEGSPDAKPRWALYDFKSYGGTGGQEDFSGGLYYPIKGRFHVMRSDNKGVRLLGMQLRGHCNIAILVESGPAEFSIIQKFQPMVLSLPTCDFNFLGYLKKEELKVHADVLMC